MEDKLNYTSAFDELQQIVDEMEGGQITVDELSERVKRAALLIRVCKAKLTETEDDVRKILEDLESDNIEAEDRGNDLSDA